MRKDREVEERSLGKAEGGDIFSTASLRPDTDNNKNDDHLSGKREEEKIKEYTELLSKFITLYGNTHVRSNEIKHILAVRLFKAAKYKEAYKLFIFLKKHYEEEKKKNNGKEESCVDDDTLLSVTKNYLSCRIILGGGDDSDLSGVAKDITRLCADYRDEKGYNDVKTWKVVAKGLVEYLVRHNYRKEATEVLVKLIGNTQKAIDQNDDEDDVELMKTLGQIKTNLAACYRDMGEHRKSLNVYLEIEALVEDEELITLTKDEVLQLKKEIAKLHYRVNNFERALVMYLQLYSDYIELHEGEESIETLSIRTSIAEVLLKQDKLEDALKIYTAVFESYLNLSDTGDSIKIHMKHIIGHVYLKEGRLFEALYTFRDVLHEYSLLYRHQVDGDRHRDVLEAKTSVACALLKEKKFEESRRLYKQVWECYKDKHGEEDKRSVDIERILLDLDNLDLMFTNEDRDMISQNVLLNEATFFGSQDFDKYILPKLNVESLMTDGKKNLQEQNEYLSSDFEDITEESLAKEFLGENILEDEDDVEEKSTKNEEYHGVRKRIEIAHGNRIPQAREMDCQVEETKKSQPENGEGFSPIVNKSNQSKTSFNVRKSSTGDNENDRFLARVNSGDNVEHDNWENISLNPSNNEDDDIIRNIREQNERTKKKKKKGCVCLIS